MKSRCRLRGGNESSFWLILISTLTAIVATDPVALSQAAEPKSEPAKTVGNSLAPGMVALVQQEMLAGFRDRQIAPQFSQFSRFLGGKLDATAGPYATSEVTNLCRLSWFDHLLREPVKAPAEAEEFTRQLHQVLCDDAQDQSLLKVLATARAKMDLKRQQPLAPRTVKSPDEALEAVKESLTGAQAGYSEALSPLNRSEIAELGRNLFPVFVSQARNGHTLPDRYSGQRLCQLLMKLDRNGLYAAAESLAVLADPQLLEQLAKLPTEGNATVAGASGTIVQQIVTPAGIIVIGGKGKNTYDLDKMRSVNVLIDLGGDDEYREGTASLERPVLVTLDLAGNDVYRATSSAVQGAALLGISMLLDVAGNDTYQAQDLAQGSAIGGVGILIDYAGSDAYVGVRRVQGQALGGFGILIDRAGNDRYHAAMWAQGFGAPGGFGLLEDLDGKDYYYAGGLYLDSYEETPGYEGWSQGVGAGLRQVANGGIGVILDGGDDDVYEFDYMGHGGGYWLGIGFARDFGGNDQHLGSTRKNYHGGPRSEAKFQRFGNGFGCHYALGFLFDDYGSDSYDGTIMGTGFGWDASVGYLCDFGGNDQYLATGGAVQGNGAQASLGVLFDYDGDDVYHGYNQAYNSPSISYHKMPECGGNFSFVVDYGGNDTYGCGVQNNSYNMRGSAGGFLIDRPSRESTTKTAADRDAKTSIEQSSKPSAAQNTKLSGTGS
jgi:hypothetical protein